MDLVSIVLMLCIGNTVGWLATIYREGGRFGLLGDVSVAVAGAMVAGLVYRQVVPVSGMIGLITAGILVSTAALLLWRRYVPAAG